MDFHELLCDILDGFIIIGKILLYLIIIAGMIIGIFSSFLVAIGKIPFLWWYVPCWIVLLITIAASVGSASKNS